MGTRKCFKRAAVAALAFAGSAMAAQGEDDLRAEAQVLRDANSHSLSLAAGGATAGHESGKFFIGSADGAFYLNPWLQLQVRNVTNYRENGKGDDQSDTQHGFELRRAKLGLAGNAFSPDLTFLFLWASDRKTGNLVAEEVFVRYKLSNELAVKVGQFKDPFSHEAMVSSKSLLAADRTLLSDVFTGGDNFVQGMSLAWDAGQFRAEAAFTDGSNSRNNSFESPPARPANFGVAARAEARLIGSKWAPYSDFTALGTTEDLLVLGAGADATQAGDTTTYLHTVDAQFETAGGLGLYAQLLGRYVSNAAAGAADLYDWGFTVQGSYLVNKNLEPFLRYSFLKRDKDGLSPGTEDKVHEITGGVNYYFHGHAAKLTLDVTVLPNGSPVSNDGSGILSNEDLELILRLQFQLLI